MPNDKIQSCRNCRFSLELENGTAHCRRYPPTVATMKTRHFIGDTGLDYETLQMTVHPEIQAHGWCGEFQLASREDVEAAYKENS